MSRSLKKGYFVDDHLIKKVQDLEPRARRDLSKRGVGDRQSSPT